MPGNTSTSRVVPLWPSRWPSRSVRSSVASVSRPRGSGLGCRAAGGPELPVPVHQAVDAAVDLHRNGDFQFQEIQLARLVSGTDLVEGTSRDVAFRQQVVDLHLRAAHGVPAPVFREKWGYIHVIFFCEFTGRCNRGTKTPG